MRWWPCFFVAAALCVASCQASPGVDDSSAARDQTLGSGHANGGTQQTVDAPLPALETLAFVSTEVTQAQLESGPTWLDAHVAQDDPGGIHRAEALWGRANDPAAEPVRLAAGDVVEASFTSVLDLGEGGEDRTWAVSWQLVGPDHAGRWPAPPLALTVGNGYWRVGGGEGHPNGSRESYADTGVPFQDGTPISWTIRVSLEPDAGTVDVWADDEHVVQGWQPPGGTMYPTQPFVLMKTGLYMGGEDGIPGPSRLQVVDAVAELHTHSES